MTSNAKANRFVFVHVCAMMALLHSSKIKDQMREQEGTFFINERSFVKTEKDTQVL